MTQPPTEPTPPADGSVPQIPPVVESVMPVAAGATVLPGAVLPDGDRSSGKARRRGLIVGTVVGLTLGILGAGGYAAYAFLSGGGAQPEDVVSADAVAFVKVDLDPAAAQKVNMARLLQSLDSSAAAADVEDPKRAIADILSAGTGVPVDYDRDLKAWIGDRAAVAVLSGEGGSLEQLAKFTQPLFVVATTDEAAAQESLSRLYDGGSGKWTVAARDGFVLVGSPSATAEPAATLASTNGYTGTEAAVGDSLAFAYLNVDRGLDLAESAAAQIQSLVGDEATGEITLDPEFGGSTLATDAPDVKEQLAKVRAELEQVPNRLGTRTIGVGLIAQPDGFDINVRAMGLSKELPVEGTVEVSKNAIGALMLQGYGDYLTTALAELPDEMQSAEATTAISALGTRLFAQFGVDGQGTPVVSGTVTGDDLQAIQQAWQLLASTGEGAFPLEISNNGQAVLIGTPGAATVFKDSEGTAKVQSVLPDVQNAAIWAYVDVQALASSSLASEVPADLSALNAVGVSVSGKQAGDLTVRLAIRLT